MEGQSSLNTTIESNTNQSMRKVNLSHYRLSLDYFIKSKYQEIVQKNKKPKFLSNFLNFFSSRYESKNHALRLIEQYSPYGLLFMNLFNMLNIINKKMFYSNLEVKTITSNLLKINQLSLVDEFRSILNFYFSTIKNIVLLNFAPSIFIANSFIFYLGYYNFLTRFYKSNDITKKDAYELFFISGLASIPFTNFIENLYKDKFINEKSNSRTKFLKNFFSLHSKFSTLCIKSILDNYLFFLCFFKLNKFIDDYDKSGRIIKEKKAIDLFKEMCDSNPTFERIRMLDGRDEKLLFLENQSMSLFYVVALMMIFYTPFDFMINLYLNSKESIFAKRKILEESTVIDEVLNRQNLASRYKASLKFMALNCFFKYGTALIFIGGGSLINSKH